MISNLEAPPPSYDSLFPSGNVQTTTPLPSDDSEVGRHQGRSVRLTCAKTYSDLGYRNRMCIHGWACVLSGATSAAFLTGLLSYIKFNPSQNVFDSKESVDLTLAYGTIATISGLLAISQCCSFSYNAYILAMKRFNDS